MPVEGWKSVSVRADVYEALEAEARRKNRNVTNLVDNILREELSLEVPA